METTKSLYMMTLGCPKNRVDSEVMLGTLKHRGYTLVQEASEAQVIVVNTCAFIGPAKQESVDSILEMAELKKSGSCSTLVVTGCLSQRYGEELAKEMPEVDHFLGTSAYAQIGDLLAAEASPRQVIPDPDYIHDADTPRINSMPKYTAYLKVSEGCDNACAFCIIPTLRGGQRSRTIDDIVIEAKRLADSGVQELNLVAQDLTAYGHDLPGRPKLHDLLKALVKVDVRWIRLHYAYPRVFPDELIEVMAAEPKIARYLDMPVQHVSDKLLLSMKRGRNSEFLKGLLTKLRERVPGLVMRTSLIVGLPGETEEDFEMTMKLTEQVRFDNQFSFIYSPRPKTGAALREKDWGPVEHEVKIARLERLQKLQRRISAETTAALVGTEVEVMVEGHSRYDAAKRFGRTPENRTVNFDGDAPAGAFVTVKVDRSTPNQLAGKQVAVLQLPTVEPLPVPRPDSPFHVVAEA